MEFGGFRNAAFQVASRPAQDDLVRQAEQRRLVTQRNQMALLDRRLQEAEMAKRQNKYGGQLESMIDPASLAQVAAMAGLSGEFKNAAQITGIDQQNTARQQALDMISAGAPPANADAFNALIGVAGDKMLGPGNIQVAGQASADTAAANALARQRNTMADYNEARTASESEPGGARGEFKWNIPVSALTAQIVGAYGSERVPEIMDDFAAFAGTTGYDDERRAWADYRKQYPQGGFLKEQAAKEAAQAVAGAAIQAATNPPTGDTADTAIPMDVAGGEPEAGKWYIGPDGRRLKWNGSDWVAQ